MIEIGRVCVKLAGRDAGKKCVIIDVLDHRFVLIDGETRRRKCNIMHLEPLSEVLKVSKNAPHHEVAKALGIEAKVSKSRPATQKPKAKRKTSEQLRVQKEEKKKIKDIFKPKKKEDKKEETLESKASDSEEKKEAPKKTAKPAAKKAVKKE